MEQILGIAALLSSIAIIATSLRPLGSKKKASPGPLEFDVPVTEAYKKILALLQGGIIGAHKWTLREAMENSHIIAYLEYREPKVNMRCDAIINFDFKESSDSKTLIRWSAKFKPWCDKATASKLETLTNQWITTALSPPPLIEPPKAVTLSKRIDCRLPVEAAFSRMLKRLSTVSDDTTRWYVIDHTKPSSIVAKLEHIDLHKKSTRCRSEIKFDFEPQESASTSLTCTYQFEPVYHIEQIESFKNLTDEWLELVLWTA